MNGFDSVNSIEREPHHSLEPIELRTQTKAVYSYHLAHLQGQQNSTNLIHTARKHLMVNG